MKRMSIASLLGTILLAGAVTASSLAGPLAVSAAGEGETTAESNVTSSESENTTGSTVSDEETDPSVESAITNESLRGADDGNTTADPDSNQAGKTDASAYTVIHISSIYDLESVADKAHFDKWSRDKRIVLDKDLNLAGTDIRLASFGGIFDGQGHTISNLTINSKVACAGLFDTIQKSGLVERLNVTGSIRPSGTQDRIGGIAGTNEGTIRDCTFNGTVEADAQVGGIVGRNETSGIVENCTADGDITGDSYTGGICGYNAGTMSGCTNNMAVNTTYSDSSVSMDQLSNTLENILMTGRINSTENIQARTDSGGVAGYNSGVIYRSTNNGEVGYEHVGYNVGGVAGRSSGYMQNCENRGHIKGRKDVGGVVGQQQPYLRLQFTEDTIEKLKDQVDNLKSTTDGLLGSADNTSSAVSDLLNQLSSLAGSANDSVKTIADQSEADLNDAADKINDAADTLNDALDDTSGIVGQVNDQIDRIKDAATNLNNTLDAYMKALDLSDDDQNKIRRYYDSLRDSIDDAQDAAKDLNELVTDRSSRTAERVQKAYEDMKKIREDLQQALEDGNAILDILDDYRTIPGQEKDDEDNTSALREELKKDIEDSDLYKSIDDLNTNLQKALEAFPGAAKDIASQTASSLINQTRPDSDTYNTEAINNFISKVQEVTGDNDDISDEISDISSDHLQDLLDLLSGPEEKIDSDLAEAAKALYGEDKNGGILNNADGTNYDFSWDVSKDDFDWVTDEDVQKEDHTAKGIATDKMDEILQEQSAIKEAIQNLKDISDDISKDHKKLPDVISDIRSNINTVVDGFANIGHRAVEIMDILHSHLTNIPNLEESGIYQALQNIIHTVNDNGDITTKVQDVLASLAGIDVSMNGVSDAVSQAGNDLYGSVNDMISVMQSLNSKVSGSTSDIISRARDLNNQINDIAHTLQDELDDATDVDRNEDNVKDDSDIDYSDVTQGRTTNCTNRGKIEADNNVGGVVGTVGVEFDLDPERDIQQIGDSSLDYDFFARAVIDHCVNDGEVESKNNYCGGIAAHMELGYVDASENYGKIKGGADYVGGISGYSAGTIRGSYAKCDLSGERYIGGIAGYGTKLYNNTSMISISESTQYAGAIAGRVKDVDEDVTGNLFVATNLRGIDNVSYDGIAQGTTYKNLKTAGTLPEAYDEIRLTFVADDETVAVVSVPYGETFSSDQLPEVPVKEGFIGKWSRTTFSRVTRDLTIKAIYTRKLDIVASSAVREGGSPVLLAEGSFSQKDTLGLIAQPAEGNETERWRVSVPAEAVGSAGVAVQEASGQGTASSGTAGKTEGNTHTFRYLATDGSTEHTTIYLITEEGSRQKLDTGTNGRYITFEADGSQFTFAAETNAHESLEEIELLTGAGGAGALVLILLLVRRRKRRRKKKAAMQK